MLSPYTFLCPPLYLALLYHANRPERYSRQHLEQKTVFLRFCHTIFVSWGEPVHSRWRHPCSAPYFPRGHMARHLCIYSLNQTGLCEDAAVRPRGRASAARYSVVRPASRDRLRRWRCLPACFLCVCSRAQRFVVEHKLTF